MLGNMVHLIVLVVSLELVFSIPIDNHPIEHSYLKSLYGITIPYSVSQESSVAFPNPSASSQEYTVSVPQSVSGQNSTASGRESSSSSLKEPPNAKKEPGDAEIPTVGYFQSTSKSPPPPGIVQKSFSFPLEDSNTLKRSFSEQEASPSFISTIASLEESPGSSIRSPVNSINENVLHQRVKRQQRRRYGWNRGGRSQQFCNQFGCNSNRRSPERSSRNSRCPSGTRFDSRSNSCRRLSRG